MPDTRELDAQIAQRLFGWEWQRAEKIWQDREGYLWVDADIPAYTTDPAATAQVWQWVWEQEQVHRVHAIRQPCGFEAVICRRTAGLHHLAKGPGATLPEALCRAALALAEALEDVKE